MEDRGRGEMLLRKKLLDATFLLLIAGIIYSFLWGRLFSFFNSPASLVVVEYPFDKAFSLAANFVDISDSYYSAYEHLGWNYFLY